MADDLSFRMRLEVENQDEIMKNLDPIADKVEKVEGTKFIDVQLKKGSSYNDIKKFIEQLNVPQKVKVDFDYYAGFVKMQQTIKNNDTIKIKTQLDEQEINDKLKKLTKNLSGLTSGWIGKDTSKIAIDELEKIKQKGQELQSWISQLQEQYPKYTSKALENAINALEDVKGDFKIDFDTTSFTKQLSLGEKEVRSLADEIAKLNSSNSGGNINKYATDVLGLTKDFQRLFDMIKNGQDSIKFNSLQDATESLRRLKQAYDLLNNEDFTDKFNINKETQLQISSVINAVLGEYKKAADEIKLQQKEFQNTSLFNDFDAGAATNSIDAWKKDISGLLSYIEVFKDKINEDVLKTEGKQVVPVDVQLNVTPEEISKLHDNIQNNLNSIDVSLHAKDDVDMSDVKDENWQLSHQIDVPLGISDESKQKISETIQQVTNNAVSDENTTASQDNISFLDKIKQQVEEATSQIKDLNNTKVEIDTSESDTNLVNVNRKLDELKSSLQYIDERSTDIDVSQGDLQAAIEGLQKIKSELGNINTAPYKIIVNSKSLDELSKEIDNIQAQINQHLLTVQIDNSTVDNLVNQLSGIEENGIDITTNIVPTDDLVNVTRNGFDADLNITPKKSDDFNNNVETIKQDINNQSVDIDITISKDNIPYLENNIFDIKKGIEKNAEIELTPKIKNNSNIISDLDIDLDKVKDDLNRTLYLYPMAYYDSDTIEYINHDISELNKEINKLDITPEITESSLKALTDTITNIQESLNQIVDKNIGISINSEDITSLKDQVENIKTQLEAINNVELGITPTLTKKDILTIKKSVKDGLDNTSVKLTPTITKGDISAAKNQIKTGVGNTVIDVLPNITKASIATQIDKIKQLAKEANIPFTVNAKLPKNALPIDKVTLKDGIIQSAVDSYKPVPTLYFTAKRKQVQEVLNRFDNLTVQAKVKTDNLQKAVNNTSPTPEIWLDPVIRHDLIQGQLDKADYHVNVDTQITDTGVETRLGEQINLLTQLRHAIEDVTNAVVAKTAAFDSEKDSVTKDIQEEYSNISRLKTIVDAVVASLKRVNKETGNDAKGKETKTQYEETRNEGTQSNINNTNALRNAMSLMTEFNNLRKSTDILNKSQLQRFSDICDQIVKALTLKVDTTGTQKSITAFYNAADKLNNALMKSDTMLEKVVVKAQNGLIKMDSDLIKITDDINRANDLGKDTTTLIQKQTELTEKRNQAQTTYNELVSRNKLDSNKYNGIYTTDFNTRRTKYKSDVQSRISQAYNDFRTSQINEITESINKFKNSITGTEQDSSGYIEKLDNLINRLSDSKEKINDIKKDFVSLQQEFKNEKFSDATKANQKLVDSYKELDDIVNSTIKLIEKRHTLEFGYFDDVEKQWKFYNNEDTSKFVNLTDKILDYLSPQVNDKGVASSIADVTEASEQALTDFKKVLNQKLSDIQSMLDDHEKYTDEYRQKLVKDINNINAAESSLNIDAKKKNLGDTEEEKAQNKADFEGSVMWSLESVALANMTTANKNDPSNLKASLKEITGLSKTLSEFMKNNAGMSLQNKQAFESLIKDIDEMAKRASVSKAEIDALTAKGRDLMAVVNNSPHNGNSGLSGFFKTLQSKNAQFIAQFFSFQDILMYIQRAGSEVENINYALTSLKKVSDETGTQLKKSFDTAAKSAKELGVDITDMINATTDWNRMGYRGAEAEQLARVSELYQNVGDGITQSQASNSLVSIIKGFNLEASDAESIVDKLNEVSNNFAVTSGGLGEALTKSSAALHASNTDLDKSLALVTTMDEVLQNDDSTGNILKTLSMRIRGADTELKALGEDTDEYTKSTSKLRDEVKALTGVDIMKDKNTFKDIYTILDEIGKKWNDLTDVEQASLAEALAGKRNANGLYAILQNIDELEKVYETSVNSAGSAEREQSNYMESMQAHIKSLQASLQEIAYDFIDSGLADNVIDFLKEVVELLDNITKGLNGLAIPTILTTIGTIYGSTHKIFDVDTNGVSFMGNYIKKSSIEKQKINSLRSMAESYYSYGDSAKQQLDKEIEANPQDETRKQFAEIFKQFDNNIDNVKSAIEDATKEEDKFKEAALQVESVTENINDGYVKVGDTIKTAIVDNIKGIALNLGVSLAINAAITLIYKLATAEQEAAKAVKDATEQAQSFNSSVDDSINQLIDLRKKLDDSNTSTEEAKSIREQMLSIQGQLNQKIKDETTNWNENLDALNSNVEALKNYKKKVQEAEWLKEKSEINKFGWSKAFTFGFDSTYTDKIVEQYNNPKKMPAMEFYLKNAPINPNAKIVSPYVDKNNQLKVDELLSLNQQELYDNLSDIQSQIEKTTGKSSEDIQAALDNLEESLGNYSGFVKDSIKNDVIYANKELDGFYDEISDTYSKYTDKITDGDTKNAEIFKNNIISDYGYVKSILNKEVQDGIIDENTKKEALNQFQDLIPNINIKDYELDVTLGFKDEQGNKITNFSQMVEGSILSPIQTALNGKAVQVNIATTSQQTGLTDKGQEYLNFLNELGDINKFKNALKGTLTLSENEERVLGEIKQDIDKAGISADTFIDKFRDTGDLVGNYQNGMQSLLTTVEQIITANGSTYDEKGLQRYFNSLNQDEYEILASVLSTQKGQEKVNKLVAAYATFIGRGKVAWQDVRSVLQSVIDDSTKLNDETKKTATTIAGVVELLNDNVAPALDSVIKMLDSAYTKDAYGNKVFDISNVDFSTIESFVKAFDKETLQQLGYTDKQIKAITDDEYAALNALNSGSEKQYHNTMNQLVTTYLNNSEAAGKVTESNKEMYITLLKSKNITNATAVVTSWLNNNLKNEAKQWFATTDALLAYQNGDKQLIASKLQEIGVTDPEKEAEKELALYKKLTTAQTEEERDKILEQADASSALITILKNLRLEEMRLSNTDIVTDEQLGKVREYGELLKDIYGDKTYASQMSADDVFAESMVTEAHKLGYTGINTLADFKNYSGSYERTKAALASDEKNNLTNATVANVGIDVSTTKDKTKQKQETKQTFDWLQRALDKMSETISDINKKNEKYGLTIKEHVKNLKELNKQLEKSNKLNKAAVDEYTKRAESTLLYYQDANGNWQKIPDEIAKNAASNKPMKVTYTPTQTVSTTKTIKGLMVAEASKNEHGTYYGGLPGNQTYNPKSSNSELNFDKLTSSPFKWIFRAKDSAIAAQMADYAVQAVTNKNIGYDMSSSGRQTFYQAWERSGSIDQISDMVATDCSALVSGIAKKSGIKINQYSSTWGIIDTLSKSSQVDQIAYSPDKVQAGDIVVYNNGKHGHAAIVVGNANGTQTIDTTKTVKTGAKETSYFQVTSQEEYNAIQKLVETYDKIHQLQDQIKENTNEIVQNEAQIRSLILEDVQTQLEARETVLTNLEKMSADIQNNKLTSLKNQTKEIAKQEKYYKDLSNASFNAASESYKAYEDSWAYIDKNGKGKLLSKKIRKGIENGTYTENSIPDSKSSTDSFRVAVIAAIAAWKQYQEDYEKALNYVNQDVEKHLEKITTSIEDVSHKFTEKINKWDKLLTNYNLVSSNPYASYKTKWGIDNLNIKGQKDIRKQQRAEYDKQLKEALKKENITYTDTKGKTKKLTKKQINDALAGVFTKDDMTSSKYSKSMKKAVTGLNQLGETFNETKKSILETENAIAEARKQKWDDWSSYFSDRITSLGNTIQKVTDKFSNIASSGAYKDTTRISAYDQVLGSQKENRALQQLILKNQQKDLKYIASGIDKKYLDEYARTGSIDTANITDTTQLRRVQEYLTQQERITDTETKIAQSYVDIQQTVVSKLEMISTKYSNIIAKTNNMLTALESGASYQESMGQIMSTKFPEAYAKMYQQMANTTLQGINEFKAEFQRAIDNGELREDSQNYADMMSKLTEMTTQYYNELSQANQAVQQVRAQLEKFAQLGDTQADLFIQSVEAEIAKLDYQLSGNTTADKPIYESMAGQYGRELGAYQAKEQFYRQQYAYWDNIFKNSDETNTEEALAKRNEYESKIYETVQKEYELRKKIKQVLTDEENAIKSYYDDLLAYEQNRLSLIEKAETTEQTLGHIVSGEYYKAENDSNQKQLALIDQQKKAMIDALQKNLDSGVITKNDSEYKQAIKDIDGLELTRKDLQNKILENMIKQRDVAYEYYNFLLDRMSKITSEADSWINLLTKSTKLVNSLNIDSNNFRDVNVMVTKYLTDTGDAVLGENYVKYQNALQKQIDLKKELAYTRKELANDPYDQNLIKKEEELTQAIQDQASAAADAKNAIVDMVKSAYDAAIADLKKQIDAYNDLLDAQKNLHDYQESIQSGTQSVAETQKMLLAYQGDTSEAGKVRTQKLQKQLKENKKSLQDTQYSKFVSDQKETLNSLYEKIQLLETQAIDDLRYGDGASFEEVIKYIQDHSDSIKNTLITQGNTWKVELSKNQKDIWNRQGDIQQVDDKIRTDVEQMQYDLDNHARDVIGTINGFHTDLNANKQALDDINRNTKMGYEAVEKIYNWAETDLPDKLAAVATQISTQIHQQLTMSPLTAKLDEGTFKDDVDEFHKAVEKFGESVGTSWKEANTTPTEDNPSADLPSTNDNNNSSNNSSNNDAISKAKIKPSSTVQATMNAYDKYIKGGYLAENAGIKLGQLAGNTKVGNTGKTGDELYQEMLQYFDKARNSEPNDGVLIKATDEKYQAYNKAYNEAKDQLAKLTDNYAKMNQLASLIDNTTNKKKLKAMFDEYTKIITQTYHLNPRSEYVTNAIVKYKSYVSKLNNKGIDVSNRFTGHAKGVHNLKANEIAWTQEDGMEAILRPSDGAILTPLKQGDSVLTAKATENLFNFAKNPFDFLKDVNATKNTTAISANNGNTVNNDINMSFTLPNVKNYDELVYSMQHDPKFEKMLRAMTTDRIFGGSSIKKYTI